jgi:HAMP domain-containing protein
LLIADDTGSEYKLWRTGDSWQTREVRRSDWAARARWHTWADDGSAPRIDWIDADYDPRHQPWFRGALRAQVALDHDIRSGDPRRVFWSEPYTFFNTGDPGITASMPFGDVSGRRRVIAFDIRLRDISRFTSGLPVSGTGSVAVLTRDNRLIGVPRHQRFPDTRSRQEALLKRPTELGWVLAVDAQDAFTSLGSDAGPVRFSSGHEAYWGQRRLFPLALARALWIVVVVPERDILGPLLELRVWVAAIVAVVVLVAILRAFVLSRRYSRPMEALVQESNRISLGDLDEGMAIGSKVTEIRQLAEAHERMREGLRSLMRIEDDLKIARRIQQNTLIAWTAMDIRSPSRWTMRLGHFCFSPMPPAMGSGRHSRPPRSGPCCAWRCAPVRISSISLSTSTSSSATISSAVVSSPRGSASSTRRPAR